MPEKPLVDVVMPVKDGAKTIRDAITSIQNQTYRNFRLVVIDDCSQDGTREIVEALAERDKRIVIHASPVGGVVAASNYGIEKCEAKYIARMDADDISLPRRLEHQVEFMEEHGEYAAVGSAIFCFGERLFVPAMLTSPIKCSMALSLYSPICHPSTMFRSRHLAMLSPPYRQSYEYAEDYDLFTRIVKFGQVANLQNILFMYRVHGTQLSRIRARAQRRVAARIALNVIKERGFESQPEELLPILFKICVQLGSSQLRPACRAIRNIMREIRERGHSGAIAES